MKAHVLSRDALLHLFTDPPLEYGDFLTWFWETGRLSKERLTWQLEELKKKGVSGTWYYVRYFRGEPYGAHPAYFTDEWWEFFRHSVAEHRRLGLQAWFSDWTGAGNYWQDRMREERRTIPGLTGRRLVVHEAESAGAGPVQVDVPAGDEILSAAAYRKVGGALDGASRRDLNEALVGQRLTWDAPGPGWLVTVVATQPHDLNYLDRIVADRWIELYFKVHEERLGEYIGNTLKLYGQDELRAIEGNIFYTPELTRRFQAEKGYDPRPHLAGLFHDIGDATDRIRCQYYDVMAALLEENFYRPLSQWHEERNLLFGTIATWGREDMLGQTWHYGDFLRLMRWFHVTGNEDPNRSEPGERCFIDAKLSSSVLHTYGRDRAGMCVYWGSGWGMTQEENMAWTNENFAYGLNLYNTHGGLYNTFGGWYEWVPPTVHWRQPYWEHWQTFADYISRVSAVMSQGVHCADVALLYPLTTIHANWLRGNEFTAAADEVATETFALARHIYWGGIDFDFVNDDILQQAQVEDGKLKVAGMEFRAVVLPPLTTIRTETLAKLKAFYEGGGTVLAFRQLPGASAEQGRHDPRIRSLLQDIFGVPSSEEYAHPTKEHSQAGDSVRLQVNTSGGRAFFVPSQEIHASASRQSHRSLDRRGASVPDLISAAITQDVVASGKDIFHTHQKIGEVDVYFLYNARPERRDLRFTFRVRGEPEIWDALTGAMIPVHRFACDGERTTIRLTMERNAGVMLVFSPSGLRPAVVEDNLDTISSVTRCAEGLNVKGLCDTPGQKRVRALYAGQVYAGEAIVDAPPATIVLAGDWGFQLKPTMNNQWGDFRYPASAEYIGAEARRFHYIQEGERSGTELGWHTAEFAVGHWPVYTHSFGSYWLTAGPFDAGQEPAGFVEDAKTGKVRGEQWEHFSFSQQFGYENLDDPTVWGGRQGVLDEFIYFGETGRTADAVRYLFTYVQAPEEGNWDLVWGGTSGQVRQVWVNGAEVLPSGTSAPDSGRVRVHLRKGPNPVLAQLVHRGREAIRAFVVFQNPVDEPSPASLPVPRLRWFFEPTGLIYDIAPERDKIVGWYRFQAPRGTQAMRLTVDACDIRAWVNGHPMSIEDGCIRLSAPAERIAQVAIRVEHKPGVYGGAAIPEPVRFECAPTQIPLGDWCEQALESYSGGAIYSKTFRLEAAHLQNQVILDLGMVNTTAEVAINGRLVGVGLGRPYCFDVSEFVREGDNQLQVTVYNTLANHYAGGPLPSDYVFEGTTLSGLIGPVTLQFLARVSLIARPVPKA